MSVDLVLVHPNGRRGIYQGLSELAAVEPPLWCAMLATYVRQKGLTVAIVDAEAEGLSDEETGAVVAIYRPLLACVVAYGHQPSASTQMMPAAGAACAAIRAIDPTIAVMLLGGHAAALPDRTLREEVVDVVCTGEGPVALVRTLLSLKAREVIRPLTDPSPLLEDLDREIPAPAWDLLPMHLYRAHNWHCLGGLERGGYASIYTTLGCPFTCAFCCIQAPFKLGESLRKKKTGLPDVLILEQGASPNSYRRWSPARIGQTLQDLAARGIRNIKIADEMFVLHRRHVEGVCDEIRRRGLDLNLWAYARTDTLKDGMAETLKAVGFNWLAFGIESGSAHVRDGSRKTLDDDSIHHAIASCRKAGIHVIANFIFGLPGETGETMRATLDLATELNCEFANFYCAMAYPGSPLYAETLATRPQDLPSSWAGYSQHGYETHPLATETLSAREIVAFRDQAFLQYFSSARYTEMIDRTFGAAGTEAIASMLGAPPLRRKSS